MVISLDKVELVINSKNQGLTVKEFLKRCNVGRSRIEQLRIERAIYINGNSRTLETILNKGDHLCFLFEENLDFIPERGKLSVVYEDEYLLVVNKPSNLLIHPSDKKEKGTLVNLVSGYYANHKLRRKIRYIHRLDFKTTGLLIFAKDFLTEAILNMMIQDGLIERYYIALVKNHFSHREGTIDAPLGRDRHNAQRYRVNPKGKRAITKYQVLQKSGENTLVSLQIITGRTHQIRVHLAYINHPIIGDDLYGDNKDSNNLFLQANELKFRHPISGEYINLKLEKPEWFK